MKRTFAILIIVIGFGVAANAQLLYQWAFTNSADTASNSAASYAITLGTGNLILKNVSGNIFGTVGADGVNPLAYFTNSVNGPQPGPSGIASFVANGQGYNSGNTAVAIATNLNLGTLYQFTVTFWAQMGPSVNGQFPRFVQLSAETNYDSGGKGPTLNGIGTSINTAPTGYPCVQNGIGGSSSSQNPIMSVTNALIYGLPEDGATWFFEAITYDGTLNSSNFVSWIGLTNQSVQIVTGGTQPAKYGGINFTTNATVLIGNDNVPTLPRALNTGGIADVRIYQGIATSNQLEVIRNFGYPPIQSSVGSPSIVVQPASGNSFVGGSRNFAVTASGNPSPSYLWRSNGVPVIGGTNATLILTNLLLAANGASFMCSVSNIFGGTNTIPAALTVVPVASAGAYAQAVLSYSPYSFWRVNEPSNSVPVPVYDYIGGRDGVALDPANMNFLSGPSSPTFYGFPSTNTSIETISPGLQSRLNMAGPGNYPNNGMTIAGWVYTPGLGNTGYGMIYNEASDIGPFFGLTFGGTGTGRGGNGSEVDYVWGSGAPASFTSGMDMNTNEWTFVALVISTNATPDTNATIYVGSESLGLLSTNDSSATTLDVIGSGSDPNILALGRATPSSSENMLYPYAGTTSQFSDVAVFYSALSPAAITNLFLTGVGLHLQAARDPNTPGNLLLNWPYGYLKSSTSVTGPYTDVPLTTNGVPYSVPIVGTQFYLVSPIP